MNSNIPRPGSHPQRLIALGASNLTRGFHTLVTTAAAQYGRNIEIFAALGHGRSYGVASRVFVRTIPSILDSGLWRALENLPPRPTRALITDVGNDIIYGFDAPQILGWINETLDRLQPIAKDIAITGLPIDSVRRLSPQKFLFCRSILFPGKRISLPRVRDVAGQVESGILQIAASRNLRFVQLQPQWYGFDPIHIRPCHRQTAWSQILCGCEEMKCPRRRSRLEAARLYLMPPERQRILGKLQQTPQTGKQLKSGPGIWLY